MSTITAVTTEKDTLVRYCQRRFDWQLIPKPLSLPFSDELHVATWVEYAKQAKGQGVMAVLQPRLSQLQFPIETGISNTVPYRSATRQGVSTTGMKSATGIPIVAPEQLELIIHRGIAGALPILVVGNRTDFETLVRALRWRNEPESIPSSMGACMITGFNNWDRINTYQRAWKKANPLGDWSAEFRAFLLQKERYQDRFMVVSKGAYSAISAESARLDSELWMNLSTQIRIAHEYTHYLTMRLFKDMQNHMLDELLADYAGLVAAMGKFDLRLFLNFLGLEAYPQFRPSGRMQNYRGTPPLSNENFKQLQHIVHQAAFHLSQFSQQVAKNQTPSTLAQHINLLALTQFSLQELAEKTAVSQLLSVQNKLMTSKEIIFNGSNK